MNILEFYDYQKQDDLTLLSYIIKWIDIEKHDINQFLGKDTHFTLLMVCSYFQKYECVKWLLEHKANSSLKSSNGHTALSFLASSVESSRDSNSWNIHFSIVKIFKQFNVNFNQTGYDLITPLEELLNTNHNIPENILLYYLKHTNIEQSTQSPEHQFDIFNCILFQRRVDITNIIVDYILNDSKYDINYQFPIISYEDKNQIIINETVAYNFAYSVSLLNNSEFEYNKKLLEYIHLKFYVNYDLLDENQRPLIVNTISNKNILTMKFMLEKEPNLLNINYGGHNIVQLCVVHNFTKGLSYFLKNNFFSKANINNLISCAHNPKMINIINQINSSYLKKSLEEHLTISKISHTKNKL